MDFQNNNYKTCQLCRGRVKLLIKRIDKYDYYYCTKCSLIFSKPLPSDKEIKEFYDYYFFGKLAEEQMKVYISQVNSNVKKIIKDIKKFINTENVNLLDYGAGNGVYSYCFSINGFNVTYCDFDKKVCEYAKQTFKNRFKVIYLENSNRMLFKKKYDIIFCNQVIEHVKDYLLLLRNFKEILKPNGLLILTTPNQMSKDIIFKPVILKVYLKMTTNSSWPIKQFFKFLKRPWICCDPPRHIYSFNVINIEIALKRADLLPLKIFSEFSINPHYNVKKIKFKNLIELSLLFLSEIGSRIIRFFDPQKYFGDNVVVFAQNVS